MEPWIAIELAGLPQGKGRARGFIVNRHRAVQIGGATVVLKRPTVKMYTPQATEDYETALGIQARLAMLAKRYRVLDRKIAVKCEILSMFAVPESWSKRETAAALAGEIRPTVKPDWDNIAKVTDAMNKIVWTDDCQIVDGRVQKFYGERSFLHVEVFI